MSHVLNLLSPALAGGGWVRGAATHGVDDHNIATGHAAYYPVGSYLKDDRAEVPASAAAQGQPTVCTATAIAAIPAD